MRSPASSTPGAPPMSLPSRPGLTGRGGEGRPHRQKRDHPRAAALRWLKFLSQTLRERKRYWLTASCPWVSFASSQLRAPRLRPRGANQNRKGCRETEMMVWDWSPAHPCGPNAKLIEALSPLCDEGKHRWSSGVTCLSQGQLSKPVSKL